jgi:hypothetical protein
MIGFPWAESKVDLWETLDGKSPAIFQEATKSKTRDCKSSAMKMSMHSGSLGLAPAYVT